MFSSKTPRDLNHDPLPHVDGHPNVAGYGRRFPVAYPTPDHCQACGTRYAPRPEFDHVQHNAPNPILVEFRQAWMVTHREWRTSQAQSYLDYLDGDVYDWRGLSDEVREHARRVLTRLAQIGASA